MGRRGRFLSFFLVVVVVVPCVVVSGGPLHRIADPHWYPATATWYGSPEGDGSDGGACGYGSLVDVKPFRARVGAVSPILFKGGEGCGACYMVKCLDKSICSRRAVTVIITDECPGGYCSGGRAHFDLGGAAFGRMAVAGDGNQLRNRGEISVMYRRTACKYPRKNIAFHINEGSTDYWLSLLVEFEDGDGDVGSMHIKQGVQYSISLKRRYDVLLTDFTNEHSLSEARQLALRNSEERRQQAVASLENAAEELVGAKLKIVQLEHEKESLAQNHATQMELLRARHENNLKSRAGLLPVQPIRLPRLDEQYMAERDAARAEIDRLKSQLSAVLIANMNKDEELMLLTRQFAAVADEARRKGIADARASFDHQFDQSFPQISNRVFSEFWLPALDFYGVPADSELRRGTPTPSTLPRRPADPVVVEESTSGSEEDEPAPETEPTSGGP